MSSSHFVRTPYNYDRKVVSDVTGTSCPEPTLCQQQFKDDCDIHKLMAKVMRTGDASILNKRTPNYGDFTGVNDYQKSLNIVIAADEAFASLPSALRNRFHNDPAEYVSFFNDSANRDEAEKLGLINPSKSTVQEGKAPSPSQQAGEPSPPVKRLKVGDKVPAPKSSDNLILSEG